MKRSPMPPRSQPLRRSTSLRSRTPMKRTASQAPRPKPLRTRLIEEADDLFSRFIRQRGQVCELRLSPDCRGTADHCCHLRSRRFLATRWDPDNAQAGCIPCHTFGHSYPAEWEAFCARLFGQEGWDALVALSNRSPQSTEEFRAVIAELRSLLRRPA